MIRSGSSVGVLLSLLVAGTLIHGCGSGNQTGGEIDFDHPYPGFSGQEFRGSKNFASLINNYREAKPEKDPWAGPFWPYTKKGIAKVSGSGSPARKYDAARCNKTHSESWEAKYHGPGVKGVESWWGHCNGWAVSAALYPEPDRPVVVNGIRFSIADIKGLLAEASMSVHADFFGERVDWQSTGSPEYEDTVPGQYFLVLTNHMGKFRRHVLIDRETGSEVWNQPVSGYRFSYPKEEDYLGNSDEAPNIYRIKVRGTLWWTVDFDTGESLTPPFLFENSNTTYYASRNLSMELWLDGPVKFDSSGKIISSGDVVVFREGDFFVGGEWTSSGHPDYMWIPYSVVPVSPGGEHQDYVNPHVDIRWIEKNLLSGMPVESCSNPGNPLPRPDPDSGNSGNDGDGGGNGNGNGEAGGCTLPWPFCDGGDDDSESGENEESR